MGVRLPPGARDWSKYRSRVPARRTALRHATLLCSLTIAWNVLSGTAAIAVAASTGSLALAGFGLNSAIDSAASAALVWRFREEDRDASRARQMEQKTLRLVGVALLAAALYVVAQAARSLLARSGPQSSQLGIALAAASLLVLPPLAYGKRRLARELQSRALHGDSVLTAAGAFLAGIALAGLVLTDTLGWWWADSVAAIAVGSVLFRAGANALRDQPMGHLDSG